MKRTRKWLLVFGVICIILSGCKKGNIKDEAKSGDAQTEESNIITWAYLFYPGISAENQRDINRILQEKGMDCQIRFVLPLDIDGAPLTGTGYASWVDDYEEKYSLDIITSGTWPAGVTADIDFVKKHMEPLDSYLKSGEGKVLLEEYTEDEWRQVSLNECTYVIPSFVLGTPDAYGLDGGVYASINAKYEHFFSEFDGSYSSLRQIYSTIGDESLRIVISGLPGPRELYGLLGYSMLNTGLPYSREEKCVVDVSKTEEIPNLLHELYADMEAGILINQAWTAEVPQDCVLVYIRTKIGTPQDGFVDYQMAPGIYELNLRAKYGISVNSKKKDRAFQVLKTCFTDPDILCLLYPGIEKELVSRRMEILSPFGKGDLSGILLEFDERQMELIQGIVPAYTGLFNNLQCRNEESDVDYDYTLNPAFDPDAEWASFLESVSWYSDICAAANQQIQEWLQK